MAVSYVVEGAKLKCTFGAATSSLCLPDGHNIMLGGKKRANISDHVGGKNIMSFGSCKCSVPPPPCSMATMMPWITGKTDVLVDGQPALTKDSMTICSCGGVITIENDGQ